MSSYLMIYKKYRIQIMVVSHIHEGKLLKLLMIDFYIRVLF